MSGLTRKLAHVERGSERLKAARSARSARVSLGRADCRRRTANSWRSTRISRSFESRCRPSSHTSANRFRTTRYASDQSNQPSLDHDKSAEPTELDAPESRGRVCEPYALGLYEWIAERFKLPAPDVPKIGPGVDPETAAEAVRSEWGLGQLPVANLIHLLEVHGVCVFSLAEESREVDAFSLWRDGTPFVFLNTQKSAEHSRMDAAHELGHLVLHWHHDLPQGREAEREAQAFASALLMPRAGVLATAPRSSDIETLIQYKLRWRVSLAALVYRMHSLALLSDWNYRGLYAELSGRGFRTAEPRPIQRETSQVLSKVFAALRKEGIGKSDVADALRISSSDLDALVFGLAILPLSASSLAGRESTKTIVRQPRGVDFQPLRVLRGGAA